jgi:hypothetical protein
MKTGKFFYILIVCMFAISSVEAYGRASRSFVEQPRAKDGQHGAPGFLEDGENGEDGKNGKNGQDGGHGGHGGGSVHGNGGNGGNGGDAD